MAGIFWKRAENVVRPSGRYNSFELHSPWDVLWFIQHCFICCPQTPLCRRMLGLNPGLLQRLLGRSNYSARSRYLHLLTICKDDHAVSIKIPSLTIEEKGEGILCADCPIGEERSIWRRGYRDRIIIYLLPAFHLFYLTFFLLSPPLSLVALSFS